MYVPVQVEIVLFVYMAYLLAQASTTALAAAAHETTSTGLLHLLLQLHCGLAILSMTIILAIPMHLLAIAAAIAEGAAGTAELAFLALKLGTASTAGVPELAELATVVEQIDKSFLSVFGRGKIHISQLDSTSPESGLGKSSKSVFTDCCIERNAMNGLFIFPSNSALKVVIVGVLIHAFQMVNSAETPVNVWRNKITIEEWEKDRLGFDSPYMGALICVHVLCCYLTNGGAGFEHKKSHPAGQRHLEVLQCLL